jgi:SAM-dependent methyltransferase
MMKLENLPVVGLVAERFKGDIKVRDYPFPYIAALAMNNDTDAMTLDAFEDWHSYVNGKGPTAYGEGLDLEVGDSFWVWSQSSAYFACHARYPGEKPWLDSHAFGRIVELGRLGWLDTLHGFGHWRTEYTVTRDDMRAALDRLDTLGVKPDLYVNHSRTETNIGGPWAKEHHKGDNPSHESYCLDLLKQFGFRFFWTDACYELSKFGDHLRYRNVAAAREALAGYAWKHWVNAPDALPENEQEQEKQLLAYFNHTLVPSTARDGSKILLFKRFRGVDVPSATSFAYQVGLENLNGLEATRGAVIVYQHFGVWSYEGRGKVPTNRFPAKPPVLNAHAVKCWQDLAERNRAGRLWIATTSRLLNYIWLRDRLVYTVEKSSERWVITLAGAHCGVLGDRSLKKSDLNGLSFLISSSAPDVVVLQAGHTAPIEMRREPDPGRPGFDALYMPWTKLEWVDLQRSSTRSGPDAPQQTKPVEPALRATEISRVAERWARDTWPAELAQGATYARGQHTRPFQYYLDRIEALGVSGQTALDAGSGTGHWSFALASRFDKVVGVDRSAERVDIARWLARQFELQNRVSFEEGDACAVRMPDESMDFVFCYSVIISGTGLLSALREFARVLKPGGKIYISFNGDDWNRYLRDVRGEKEPRVRKDGLSALYNTICATVLRTVETPLSDLRLKMVEEPAFLDEFCGQRSKSTQVVRDSLARLRPIKRTDPQALETAHRLAAELGAADPSPMSAIVALQDLFVAAGVNIPLKTAAENALQECGADGLHWLLVDIACMVAGQNAIFTHAGRGRGYGLKETEEAVEQAGFENFVHASEGMLRAPGFSKPIEPIYADSEGGDFRVWEFMATKPAVRRAES